MYKCIYERGSTLDVVDFMEFPTPMICEWDVFSAWLAPPMTSVAPPALFATPSIKAFCISVTESKCLLYAEASKWLLEPLTLFPAPMTMAPLLFVTLLAVPAIMLAMPLLLLPVMDSLELNVPITVAKAFLVALNVSGELSS